jgi:hypothetical protein
VAACHVFRFSETTPRSVVLTHLKLFFISRSLAITSIGSVFPVAFCITGSYSMSAYETTFVQQDAVVRTSTLMKTLCDYKLISIQSTSQVSVTYFLISNGEFPLCFLIIFRKSLELLDRFAL